MMDALQRLGATALGVAERLGRGTLFLLHVLGGVPGMIPRFGLVIKQVYATGVLSLLIIAVSGLFVGMVLGLQGYNTLVDFGATESLGVVVSLSLVRELGPVVAALLFAGRDRAYEGHGAAVGHGDDGCGSLAPGSGTTVYGRHYCHAPVGRYL
jgi:phospholipid/cholesterol/gamma-HCH transport system permease protein